MKGSSRLLFHLFVFFFLGGGFSGDHGREDLFSGYDLWPPMRDSCHVFPDDSLGTFFS